jgi:hypothetical protein
VFFGNYDYHLDTDFYPIREQNSWAYWALVQPLIRTIEELGMNFGNSPYAHICDTEGLRSIVHWLSSTCNKRFAVMSLQFNQTRTFYCLREENLSANINSLQDMDSDPGKILMEFEENRLKGRSFSLAGNTRRIITPQEYLLARKRKEDGKM